VRQAGNELERLTGNDR